MYNVVPLPAFLTRDPTACLKQKIGKEIKDLTDQNKLAKSQTTYLTPEHFISPLSYGLPKRRKESMPLKAFREQNKFTMLQSCKTSYQVMECCWKCQAELNSVRWHPCQLDVLSLFFNVPPWWRMQGHRWWSDTWTLRNPMSLEEVVDL